ncbi:hypothetical protein A1D22_01025 [Pasteurellaceae bacterium LFhippo2]|nr:hypothetical protein [Pasteurellaceae bacterium LFhippo2]
MKRELENAQKAVLKLKQEQHDHIIKLQGSRKALADNGINTRKLSSAQRELQQQMQKANKTVKEQDERLKLLNQRAATQQRYKQQVANLRQTGDNLRYMGQSAEQIAQQIQKALADQQRKAQAKARSSLRDRY